MSIELKRGTILGSYELLMRVGRGGMANVWVARGRPEPGASPQLVAIKAMLPELAQNMEFRSMFLDEGQIVRSIDHPNVVRVYDVAESKGILYMAMEWVEGDSLHTLIAEANKRRPIPPELAVRMIADTASGLHAAHELRGWDGELSGIVHCDVSPHNILIGLDGAVKLVDFGVAGAMNRVTQDDETKIRGKFGYMSPEQAQAKPLDRRSDVFSLGIVLFELTTGYRLFRGRDDRHTLDLVIFGKIPRPSQVVEKYPPKLEAIVNKALERDVAARYQTADELRDALEAYLVEERTLVPSAGVKGLLKRVLGERLEERRQQIRGAIRALDGSHPGGPVLVSEDSILSDDDPISVSVNEVKPVAYQHYSSPSGIGAARLPSDASSGAHSVSHPGGSTVKRGPPAGLILGAVTLAGVLVTVLLIVNARNEDPQVTEMGQKAASAAAPSGPAAAIPPSDRSANEKSGLPIENLPQVGSIPEGSRPLPVSGPSLPAGDRQQRLAEDIAKLKTNAPQDAVVLADDRVSEVANAVTLDDSRTRAAPAEPARSPREASSSGEFDRAAATGALGRAASMVGMCSRRGGETGPGSVKVTFATSGKVQSVAVQGPYAGTPVGECVAGHFRRVKIPKFSGDSVTVVKSFTVPK